MRFGFGFPKMGVAFALLAASGLLLSGCGTTPEVTRFVHPITGARTDVLAQNLIDEPGNNREMIWLDAYRDFTDKYHYNYYLLLIYGGRQEAGYLDIGPGRSLTIVADGQEMNFTGLGTLKKWEDKGAVFEEARYDATSDDMHRIASAKDVTVRITGIHGTVLRKFAQENSEKFRKFVEQVQDENL
jgi:hypothetical protein